MDPMNEAAALPGRIEALLDEIARTADPSVVERAEELVAAVVNLYGAGLSRVVALSDEAQVRRFTEDGLLGQLLLLHELNPDTTEQRIQAALDRVRPYLGSHAGGIEFLGVDDDGIAHLRLEGSCDSCPSSTATVQGAIEKAILDAAPEVQALQVDGMVEPPPPGGLLQIVTKRPEFESCPVPEPAGT
jgi:Fe-S cluster biogenesis protein NfuA